VFACVALGALGLEVKEVRAGKERCRKREKGVLTGEKA
jgi:hypothetical protein